MAKKKTKKTTRKVTKKKTVRKKSGIANMIGKVCMFRTYSAGVHFGELSEREGQMCLVKNAQRVFYWTQACSLSQLAMEGSKDFNSCKISMPVSEIILEQVIEIIPMPKDTVKAFREAKQWKK